MLSCCVAMGGSAAVVSPAQAASAATLLPPSSQRSAAAAAAAVAVEGAAPVVIKRLPLLLVSDLDDTILPGAYSGRASEADTARLVAALRAARAANSGRPAAAGARCCLAINTGRTKALFERAVAERGLGLVPVPDALIAGVGTRVYWRRGAAAPLAGAAAGSAAVSGAACAAAPLHAAASSAGADDHPAVALLLPHFDEDPEWTRRMDARWCRRAVGRVVSGAVEAHGAGGAVYLQRDEEQHEHKCTFLYRSELRDQIAGLLSSGLAAAGVAATVVDGAAAERGWRFADVLPAAAGKGAAMEYVRERLGFDAASTVAAGDGANDLLMLSAAARAICVGNAQPEVLEWARAAQLEYHGDGGSASGEDGGGEGGGEGAGGGALRKRVHIAPPDKAAAAGVLDGLRAFGFV